MTKPTGNFLVSFKPGVVTGIYNESETKLRNLCAKFSGFDCKVFDAYQIYAKFADDGLLVRVEKRNTFGFGAVYFFYPAAVNENEIRKKIVNSILYEIKDNPKTITNGYVVLCDDKGNFKLVCSKKRTKASCCTVPGTQKAED